jgi:hypothetical protein
MRTIENAMRGYDKKSDDCSPPVGSDLESGNEYKDDDSMYDSDFEDEAWASSREEVKDCGHKKKKSKKQSLEKKGHRDRSYYIDSDGYEAPF